MVSIESARYAFKTSSFREKKLIMKRFLFFFVCVCVHTQQNIQIILMDWVQIHHQNEQRIARLENFREF